MGVFMVLSSLSVAFYLFVLLGLYLDNRKRPSRRVQVYSYACFDDAKARNVSNPRRYPQAGEVHITNDALRFLVTKVQLKQGASGATGAKRQPIALPVGHGSAGH